MDGSLGFMVGVSACVGVKGEEVRRVSVMCMQSIQSTNTSIACSKLSYLGVDEYAGTHVM